MRDLSFFEKQKQRIEKFDKMIQNYMQSKEKEFVFDCNFYKQNHESIKALLFLEQYFNKESQFLEQLIESKLIKDFEYLLTNIHATLIDDDEEQEPNVRIYQTKFFFKFSKALVAYVE